MADLSDEGGMLWLDGGVGTSLGEDTPGLSWVPTAALLRPEAVQRVHKAFLQAGCTAITTATYACTPRITKHYLSLARRSRPSRRMLCAQLGVSSSAELEGAHALLDESLAAHDACVRAGGDSDDFWLHCARAGARVAVASAAAWNAQAPGAAPVAVVASCPPLRDSYDFEDTDAGEVPFYRQLAEVMAEEGVQILLLETVPSLAAAARALPALWGARPREVWVSFVPRLGSSGEACTLAGEPLVEGLRRLPPGARATRFLCNCGSLESCAVAVRELAQAGWACGACPNVNATDAGLDHAPFGLADLVLSWLGADEEEEAEGSDSMGTEAAEPGVRAEGAPAGPPVGAFMCQAAQTCGPRLRVLGGCCTVSPEVLADARRHFQATRGVAGPSVGGAAGAGY